MAPQITLIVITTLGLGVGLAKHGQPAKDHNFTSDLIATGILYAILWWGGFFSPMFHH